MTRLGFVRLLAAAALAAGCGGGGGGERLSKEGFIAAADAICTETEAELDAFGEPQSFEELAELTKAAVRIQGDAVARLRGLSPPEADQATIDAAYDLLDQQIELGRQLVEAAEASDLETINRLVDELGRINDQADQFARDYGLKVCGSSGA